MTNFQEKFEAINQQLDLKNQNWLFGAGISYNANIPLMKDLTELVEEKVSNTQYDEIYKEIKNLFSEKKRNMHIEHILSHIGDLIALIERTENDDILINQYTYDSEILSQLYSEIIKEITNIVRYGNCLETKKKGTINNPLVKIDEHREFIKALLSRLENFKRRSNVNFFTTNYDTLLEDSLNLEKRKVIDGFNGNSMGFWEPNVFDNKENDEYIVCKLHGSIDWYQDDEAGLVRVRYGTTYLKDEENTMIYPQATKYVETQKDPFAVLFENFRSILKKATDSMLGICGYSFGDNHINNEIEFALTSLGNQLTILIFISEEEEGLPLVVQKWLKNPKINERIYVLTQKGIYHENILHKKDSEENNEDLNWWTFEGLTDLLSKGGDYNV